NISSLPSLPTSPSLTLSLPLENCEKSQSLSLRTTEQLEEENKYDQSERCIKVEQQLEINATEKERCNEMEEHTTGNDQAEVERNIEEDQLQGEQECNDKVHKGNEENAEGWTRHETVENHG